MRINKFIAENSKYSRREADEAIRQGLVILNGQTAKLGDKLRQGDLLVFQGQHFRFQEQPSRDLVYLALFKPAGITCTCDGSDPQNIISYLGTLSSDFNDYRIYPVGRLDKDSRGLILLTNDGDFTYQLSHPKFEHEKEYEVVLQEKISEDFINRFSSGLYIESEEGELVKTAPCQAGKISNKKFKVILKQGLNRQIRKMCSRLGNEVTDLLRTRVGSISLQDLGLKEGEYSKIMVITDRFG